ncbi:MAG: CHASE domain-containing protein [Rickettsiales bacterium]
MLSIESFRRFRFYAGALAGAAFAIGTALSFFYAKYAQDANSARMQQTARDNVEKVTAELNDFIAQKTSQLQDISGQWTRLDADDYDAWRQKAQKTLDPSSGLRAMEWADKSFHVRWAEPEKENQNVLGMSIIFDDAREKALESAGQRRTPTLTPPLDLVQGYKGMILYMPIYVFNQFNGFVIAIFDIKKLAETVVAKRFDANYRVDAFIDDDLFYTAYFNQKLQTETPPLTVDPAYNLTSETQIHQRRWSFRASPTDEYFRRERYVKPMLTFLSGLAASTVVALLCHVGVNLIKRSLQSRAAAEKKR